ncbi:hypothetical protein CRUP_014398 [Coryphaenoides rupestris]|nr:hypothetical protein CRUP_014398 [Coryphaenoides rupestris]
MRRGGGPSPGRRSVCPRITIDQGGWWLGVDLEDGSGQTAGPQCTVSWRAAIISRVQEARRLLGLVARQVLGLVARRLLGLEALRLVGLVAHQLLGLVTHRLVAHRLLGLVARQLPPVPARSKVQTARSREICVGSRGTRSDDRQLEQLQKELNFLEDDIKRVEEMSGLHSPLMEAECTVPNVEAPSPALSSSSSLAEPPDYSQTPGFIGATPGSQGKRQPWYNSTLASRRKRLTAHFEDLEQCYFSNKMSRISEEGRSLGQLDDFMECLSKFTRYNSVRPLATLSYASDLYNGSSIVSRCTGTHRRKISGLTDDWLNAVSI